MKDDKRESGDAGLTALLRSARQSVELPPGFQDRVWRRIEKCDVPSVNIMDRIAQWFLTPRLATAAVAVVVVLAAGVGAVRGIQKGDRQARDHYVALVDPSYLER
jgi:hypothetical protein